jgi:uncharacterized protein
MAKLKRKRVVRITLYTLLFGFLLLNILAYNHAYRFTHFASEGVETGKEEQLSFGKKLAVLFTGITKKKSTVANFPEKPHSSFSIASADSLKGWIIPVEHPRGIVVMGHGYASNKGAVLGEAYAFNELGYTTVLFDFRGHGESAGNVTTIGYKEAEDAAAVYRYIRRQNPDSKIYLYGISMGAVAMLRAVADLDIKADGLIMECPYGSMLDAAQNRFRIMNVPSFPAAQVLVFWGGIQNGFWAYDNNSYDYATRVNMPALVIYGKNDARATEKENKAIFEKLRGNKTIVEFNAGHQSYYVNDSLLWKASMEDFLAKNH